LDQQLDQHEYALMTFFNSEVISCARMFGIDASISG
jgi:hypothetical protein